jgi:hypothetical protein
VISKQPRIASFGREQDELTDADHPSGVVGCFFDKIQSENQVMSGQSYPNTTAAKKSELNRSPQRGKVGTSTRSLAHGSPTSSKRQNRGRGKCFPWETFVSRGASTSTSSSGSMALGVGFSRKQQAAFR